MARTAFADQNGRSLSIKPYTFRSHLPFHSWHPIQGKAEGHVEQNKAFKILFWLSLGSSIQGWRKTIYIREGTLHLYIQIYGGTTKKCFTKKNSGTYSDSVSITFRPLDFGSVLMLFAGATYIIYISYAVVHSFLPYSAIVPEHQKLKNWKTKPIWRISSWVSLEKAVFSVLQLFSYRNVPNSGTFPWKTKQRQTVLKQFFEFACRDVWEMILFMTCIDNMKRKRHTRSSSLH